MRRRARSITSSSTNSGSVRDCDRVGAGACADPRRRAHPCQALAGEERGQTQAKTKGGREAGSGQESRGQESGAGKAGRGGRGPKAQGLVGRGQQLRDQLRDRRVGPAWSIAPACWRGEHEPCKTARALIIMLLT